MIDRSDNLLEIINLQTQLINQVQLGLDTQTFQTYKSLVWDGNEEKFWKDHYLKMVDIEKFQITGNILISKIIRTLKYKKELKFNFELVQYEMAKIIKKQEEHNCQDLLWLTTQFDSIAAFSTIRFLIKHRNIHLAFYCGSFRLIGPELANFGSKAIDFAKTM